MAAYAAYSIIYFRDFFVAGMLLSLTLSDSLYPKIRKQQRKWLLPYWLAWAIVLAGLYFIADFIVFPHSARSAHRLQDACINGPLFAFVGLLAAYGSPERNLESLTTSSQLRRVVIDPQHSE
ncbi:MAG: hypothetical protein ACRYFS_10070 [Janthinobacterium lividum]